MVKIKNHDIFFTRIVFFILYFGHHGQRYFRSKSLNVLLSNGYKKGGKPHLKVWPPTTYL